MSAMAIGVVENSRPYSSLACQTVRNYDYYCKSSFRRAEGMRSGASGDQWRRGFHATRESHVESILSIGLAIGGELEGVMKTSFGMTPWSDEVYGLRPVFVFLDQAHRSNYSWDIPGDEEPEKPRWLEVNLEGLTLSPDLWELHEVTESWVCPDGFWWGDWGPDPTEAPEGLRPFLETDGVITFEKLLDAAAIQGIELSRSAAIFTSVEPDRISLLGLPGR